MPAGYGQHPAAAIDNEEKRERDTMKLTDLPLDTWVVVEPVTANEVNLLSRHATQIEAEGECDKRNRGLGRRRYAALKALAPVAGVQGCAASAVQFERGT